MTTGVTGIYLVNCKCLSKWGLPSVSQFVGDICFEACVWSACLTHGLWNKSACGVVFHRCIAACAFYTIVCTCLCEHNTV